MKLQELVFLPTQKISQEFDIVPSEVTLLRKEAFERFKILGLPKAKDEIFGKTGIRTLYEVDYLKDLKVANTTQIPQSSNYRVVFRKGFYSPMQSVLPQGVEVNFESNPALQTHSSNPFYFLSYSLNKGFYRIEIEEGLELDKPLEIVYLDELHASQNHMHVSLHVKPYAKANIFERILVDSATFFNHTLSLFVGQGANVVHMHDQSAQMDTHIISNYQYVQEENSQVEVYSYEHGSSLSISLWDLHLKGENAKMDFVALQMPKERQNLSTIVNLHHDAPNTHSSQLIKQAINDEAKGVVDAKVVVSKNGAGTKSDQLCNSLILSPSAQVQSFVKPQLEIFIDDLEASHGATVGSLDEEQIYYLMSRGIAYESARKILIDAFSEEAYERFPSWAKEFISAS